MMDCCGEKGRKSLLHTQRFLDDETHLLDLPSDLLNRIVLSTVKTPNDGPRDFSRIRSVCKDFLRAAEDKDVLKAIKFDGQIKASWLHGFSGHINGLAYRCACAGNYSAHCLLAEEVVGTIPNILAEDRAQYPERLASATFFLSNFDFITSPEYKSYDCVPRKSIHHVEVVRTFFLECSPQDVLWWPKILECMTMYCAYFASPWSFRLGVQAYLDVTITVVRLLKLARLFQCLKEALVKFCIPSLEKELVGIDARLRAATEELKMGLEIYERPTHSSILKAVRKLCKLCLEFLDADQKVSELLLRHYRETEKMLITFFQLLKVNVVCAIDGYFLGSHKPPEFHINDASAFEGYHYPVHISKWQQRAMEIINFEIIKLVEKNIINRIKRIF